MTRTILHCDLNSFYASVEILLNPELRGKAVAVCGSAEDRHGIVLAKSDKAKLCNVKTGDTIHSAKQKCPELIIVSPHFEQYIKYSKIVRSIYEQYTDMVEPFGIDECWLDVTGSIMLFGDGTTIAEKIREQVKADTGLTISVGVSFNKIFAKLGSDLKKPDAVTVIDKESFKQKIWALSVGEMMGVGRSTENVLRKYGIKTLGQLANSNIDFIEKHLGKCGHQLWCFANGYDNSPVCHTSYHAPVKSIGHGTTCKRDLCNNHEIWLLMLELSQEISQKLRKHGLMASGVQISVKDNTLTTKQFQKQIDFPTQSFMTLAKQSFELFKSCYTWQNNVRAVSIRAINLRDEHSPLQLNLTVDYSSVEKRDTIENTMQKIRNRYGEHSINMCCLLNDTHTTQAWLHKVAFYKGDR